MGAVPLMSTLSGRLSGGSTPAGRGGAGGSIDVVTTVDTVQRAIDEFAPFVKAAGWDPVGLQIGDPDHEVSRVAVCHEVTGAVMERAVVDGIDLLVSYHPLLFRPTARLVAGPGPAGRALALARAGVSLLVVHTAFDVSSGGTADALADALELTDTKPFDPIWGSETAKVVTFAPEATVDRICDAMAGAGAGQIGAYSRCMFRVGGEGTFEPGAGSAPLLGTVGARSVEAEVRIEMVAPQSRVGGVVAALVAAHPYEEPAFDVYERRGEAGFVGRVGIFAGSFEGLLDAIRERLGGTVRHNGRPGGERLKVGVVPGSGAGSIPAAAEVGADVLVTGDVKHHDVRSAAELGVAVVDPGHAATEGPGVERLYAAVAATIDDAVDLTGIDADPWA